MDCLFCSEFPPHCSLPPVCDALEVVAAAEVAGLGTLRPLMPLYRCFWIVAKLCRHKSNVSVLKGP